MDASMNLFRTHLPEVVFDTIEKTQSTQIPRTHQDIKYSLTVRPGNF